MSTDKKSIIREKLTRTRAELMAFIQQVDEATWQKEVYSEGDHWTMADILRHLVDAERGMTRLMIRIQEGHEGVPPDFDQARWNRRAIEKSRQKSIQELIEEMSENRQQLLAFIETIQPDDWQKKGRHASLRILSIEEICHLIADHEERHLRDMRQVAGVTA
ncbi:MAG: DinB family protein [Chloroflexi bacterium]|nr:MAG: DinB family protein [Chloroflexota bacterium]